MNNKELIINLGNLIQLNNELKFIENVKLFPTINDEPHLFHYGGDIKIKINNEKDKKYYDYASALNNNQLYAMFLTYAEALERHLLSEYNITSMTFASYTELTSDKIDITKIINSSKIQNNDIINLKIYWDTVKSYFDNKDILIPSQLIYVPFNEDKNFIRLPITTGAALGQSPEFALYNSICEIIERHNFMITYLNKISPTKITNIKNDYINELIKYFKRYDLKIHLFKLNKEEEFHSIITVIEDLSDYELSPKLVIGASCDIEINKAIIKSIFEAQKTRIWIRNEININPDYFKEMNKMKNVKTILDRGLFWGHKKNKKNLNFILNTKNKYKNEIKNESKKLDIKEKLNIILEYLKKNKYTLLIKNINIEELNKINMYMNKVIIPEMMPLYLFEHFKYDIHPDLNKIDLLNKIPHPFL